jgi:hypothetical protein
MWWLKKIAKIKFHQKLLCMVDEVHVCCMLYVVCIIMCEKRDQELVTCV